MATKTITKQEQLNSTKLMYEIMLKMQEELPGKYFQAMEQLKNSLALVNNSIAIELQGAETARQGCQAVPEYADVPCANGVCDDSGANVQP